MKSNHTRATHARLLRPASGPPASNQKPRSKPAPFSILAPLGSCITYLETRPTVPPGQAPRGTYFQVQHYDDACWYIKNHYEDPNLAHGRSAVSITNRSGDYLGTYGLNHLVYRLTRTPTAAHFLALTFDLKLYRHSSDFGSAISRDVSKGIADRYYARCVDLSERGEYFVFSNGDSLVYMDYDLRSIGNWKIPHAFDRQRSAPSAEIQRALMLLGLPQHPSPKQIKSAYHRNMFKVHPDINRDYPNATDKTRAVNEAYEALTRGILEELTSDEEFLGRRIQIALPALGNSVSATEAKIGSRSLYVGCYSGKVYQVSPSGKSTVIYDAHAAIRRLKQLGTYLYVVSYDFCDVLDHGVLINRIHGNFGFDRTIFEPECIAILATRKLLRLYSLGGIAFGEIAFNDNIADAYMHAGRLSVVTAKKSYAFAVEPPTDYKALDLDRLYLPA